jgi:hypothetical protein
VAYLHWRTDWGFERYDVYLGEIKGYKYFWSFEPDKKKSQILKCNDTSLSVLDASTSDFEPTRATEYLEHLKSLAVGPLQVTDEDFSRYRKLVNHAPFPFTEIIRSTLKSRS